MRNRKHIIIILLSTLALTGLIIMQGRWLQRAIKLSEQEFERDIKNLLIRSFSHNSFVLNPHKTYINPGVSENEKSVVTNSLKTRIDSVFLANKIQDSYAFAVMGCCDKNIIFSSNSNQELRLQQSRIVTPLNFGNTEHSNHLSLVFTSKKFFLIKYTGKELLISLLLFLVFAGCYVYTIYTLNRYKKLADLRSDFINNMSHELKTPLGAIRLASKMLNNENHSATKRAEYSQLIDSETRRLESQLDKVLQTAVIESGNFELNRTLVNAHSLIERIVTVFQVIVSKTGGIIETKLNATRFEIDSDPHQLSNLLYNLLDNAVKYTELAPKIVITTNDKFGFFEIEVADNGIGIDPAAQEFVFEKFYRVKSRPGKGFGLGLNYVRHIVDAHKGKIELVSSPGKGTTFKIYLPIK